MFLASEGDNNCIKVFSQSGTFLYKFGKEGNQDGQFNSTDTGLMHLAGVSFKFFTLLFSFASIDSHRPFSVALKFHSYSLVESFLIPDLVSRFH